MASFPALYEYSTGELHAVSGATFLVGRSEQADIPVFDQSCSRQHFQIVRIADTHYVKPLSKTSITKLDGRPLIATTPIAHGSDIQAGASLFRFFERDDVLPESPPDRGTVPPVEQTIARPSEGTLLAEPGSADSAELDRAIPLAGRMFLGRDAERAQVHLPHMQVSRMHACVELEGGVCTVADLNSANGTFVNGQRINRRVEIKSGDRVDVGPYALIFTGREFIPHSRANNVTLVCQNVRQVVTDRATRQPLVLLDGINLVIHPHEFVCILGPSGSGKSTLLSALSARVPASDGQVLINGEDLYANFDALKQTIALVPQKDVLHDLLPVREAWHFTARLRLPEDTSPGEVEQALDEMLETVGLKQREHTQIRHLSGGQIKRASLGNEIISKPSLLFLDEVTSGLDEQTDREMMALFRRIADAGKTVVCITHNLANVERNCHLVVILTSGGKLAFVGTPAEALAYFGIERLGDIYERMAERTPEEWQTAFQESPSYSRYIDGRLPDPDDERHSTFVRRVTPTFKEQLAVAGRQLGLLVRRYLAIQLADRRSLAIMFGQSLLVAALLVILFGRIGDEEVAVQAGHTQSILFLLAISCIWFGCNNAAKEIVKERTIYSRERDVNLNVVSYYTSKLLLLGVASLAQATALYLAVKLFCGVPGSFLGQWFLLSAQSLAGVTLGLLISSASKTEDIAVTVVPLVLIPQIILAGLIAPLDGLGEFLAQTFNTSYWGFRGLNATLSGNIGDLTNRGGHSAILAWLMVMLHTAAFAFAALLVLVGKDRREMLYERALDRLARGKKLLGSRLKRSTAGGVGAA